MNENIETEPLSVFQNHGNLGLPLLAFLLIQQLFNYIKTHEDWSKFVNENQKYAELITSFCASFLLLQRAAWFHYMVEDSYLFSENQIIFWGTIFQIYFSIRYFVGTANPLTLYFQGYVGKVNQLLKKNDGNLPELFKIKINPLTIISEIKLVSSFQVLGHILGVLANTRFCWCYSPLKNHQILYSASVDSDDHSTNTIAHLENYSITYYDNSYFESIGILIILLSSTVVNRYLLPANYCNDQLRTFFQSAVVAICICWAANITGANFNPALATGCNFSYLAYSLFYQFKFEPIFEHLVVFWVVPVLVTHLFAYFYVTLECVLEQRRGEEQIKMNKKKDVKLSNNKKFEITYDPLYL